MTPGDRPRVVFMFSGQGSQYFQMGRDLYDQHAVYRETMHEAERLVRRRQGRSLLAELHERDRAAPFDDLRLSHPALLAVGVAVYRTLVHEGICPDAVWGTSLGEFIAATVCGAWTFPAAMDAVMAHARLVTTYCPTGGMLAVLGDEACEQSLCAAVDGLAIAGRTFATHFTLAGSPATLDAAQAWLTLENIPFQRLPVRYAFHSSAVDNVELHFKKYCATLQPPSQTHRHVFLSGLDGMPVERVDADYLWRVTREPMRFSQVMSAVDSAGPAIYVDCGPSGTLATFSRYALPEGSSSKAYAVVTPFCQSMQSIAKVKALAGAGVAT